ncbi:Desiccation-related protein PCC13-62 [Zea mays]|uniref:Desiccation-related protein PCC13-62 n=1 Tax=Zea mays TaxID=4577 RepID=A0A3L6FXA6_MAIZE|nr:Desiccation-related protein PCC13-62 [Zea mays]
MGAPALSSVVVVATAAVVCLCGAFAQAQDMDSEWARPAYRGFFGAPAGSLLPQSDVDLLEFPLNLEYLETEFFCWSALGAIKQTVRGFPRPLLDISAANFGKIIEQALNATLDPPFDPYENSLNFLVASYIIPYVGLTGYVGANPRLLTPQARKLLAGLLAVESAQDAVIRTLLYERGMARVPSYAGGVAEITARISDLRNSLGRRGVKDEGLVVAPELGPEGLTVGNIIAGDHLSLAYDRTPEEILGIVYGTGNSAQHGGFFPQGADGRIARGLLA